MSSPPPDEEAAEPEAGEPPTTDEDSLAELHRPGGPLLVPFGCLLSKRRAPSAAAKRTTVEIDLGKLREGPPPPKVEAEEPLSPPPSLRRRRLDAREGSLPRVRSGGGGRIPRTMGFVVAFLVLALVAVAYYAFRDQSCDGRERSPSMTRRAAALLGLSDERAPAPMAVATGRRGPEERVEGSVGSAEEGEAGGAEGDSSEPGEGPHVAAGKRVKHGAAASGAGGAATERPRPSHTDRPSPRIPTEPALGLREAEERAEARPSSAAPSTRAPARRGRLGRGQRRRRGRSSSRSPFALPGEARHRQRRRPSLRRGGHRAGQRDGNSTLLGRGGVRLRVPAGRRRELLRRRGRSASSPFRQPTFTVTYPFVLSPEE